MPECLSQCASWGEMRLQLLLVWWILEIVQEFGKAVKLRSNQFMTTYSPKGLKQLLRTQTALQYRWRTVRAPSTGRQRRSSLLTRFAGFHVYGSIHQRYAPYLNPLPWRRISSPVYTPAPINSRVLTQGSHRKIVLLLACFVSYGTHFTCSSHFSRICWLELAWTSLFSHFWSLAVGTRLYSADE